MICGAAAKHEFKVNHHPVSRGGSADFEENSGLYSTPAAIAVCLLCQLRHPEPQAKMPQHGRAIVKVHSSQLPRIVRLQSWRTLLHCRRTGPNTVSRHAKTMLFTGSLFLHDSNMLP